MTKLGVQVDDPQIASIPVAVPPLVLQASVAIGAVRRAARRGMREDTPITIRCSAPVRRGGKPPTEGGVRRRAGRSRPDR
ncbi:MAG TPA: hypothetical protein VE646_10480 [Actinomycetota bacterium]|nr:hypothetical protein [Actinomycetota bacterium]